MLDPDPNRIVDFSWTESNSRNPEIWLSPYNGNTGTVVGKVTDVNGDPVGGLLVYGARSGHNPDGLQKNPAWDYRTSLTYNNAALKPDDILVENWATTDVTPGTYTITLSNGSNLGRHTVQAGQITYVGLYPVWLPDIRNSGGWGCDILVRNNSSTFRAQVNTTFFTADGAVKQQRTDSIDAGAVAHLPAPSDFGGSAMVVSSKDVAVIVEHRNGDIADSYNGIAASDSLNPGWGQISTTLYAPVIMNNYYDWTSRVVLVNTGAAPANDVKIQYYTSGAIAYTDSFTLPVHGHTVKNYDNGTSNVLYSARVTSDQPLAMVVRQRNSTHTIFLTYNSLSAGATTVYAPLIMNNYYGWDTSVNVQNTSSSWAYLYYIEYRQDNGQVFSSTPAWIPPYSTLTYWSPNQGLPGGFIGSARIVASQPVVVVVNQSSPHGSTQTRGMSYAGATNGTASAVLPDVLSHMGSEDWVSSVNVQNLGTSSTVATLRFAGQVCISTQISAQGFYSFYVPNCAVPNGTRGTATVSASGSQPMAVVVNHSGLNLTWTDLARCYNGVNR